MRSAHLSALGDTTRRSGATPGPQLHCWTPVVVPFAVPSPGLMSPALLESVDQWSRPYLKLRFLEGRPAESPFVGVVWGLDPSPRAVAQPASARKGV
ncbi:hypothetical protein N7444_001972 [Penicillium canescens]|nr:hypothetical protein N7444_001972 [Penicillium canescens]